MQISSDLAVHLNGHFLNSNNNNQKSERKKKKEKKEKRQVYTLS